MNRSFRNFLARLKGFEPPTCRLGEGMKQGYTVASSTVKSLIFRKFLTFMPVLCYPVPAGFTLFFLLCLAGN